jgi:hypothetical protein
MTPPVTQQRVKSNASNNSCLSCGMTKNMGKKKYCSVECRQQLRQNLNMHTGLLKALSTQYATFYFTRRVLVLDILTYGSNTRFRFIGHRFAGKKPAEDFRQLADRLGNTWWAEKKRTDRWYLASKHLLSKASKAHHAADTVKPMVFKKPTHIQKSISFLEMRASEVTSPKLKQKIKTAYRKQAKKHHPDNGGDAVFFRKVHVAYQEMTRWADNPTFIQRRGFPDKWFYDDQANRWVQPMPGDL